MGEAQPHIHRTPSIKPEQKPLLGDPKRNRHTRFHLTSGNRSLAQHRPRRIHRIGGSHPSIHSVWSSCRRITTLHRPHLQPRVHHQSRRGRQRHTCQLRHHHCGRHVRRRRTH